MLEDCLVVWGENHTLELVLESSYPPSGGLDVIIHPGSASFALSPASPIPYWLFPETLPSKLLSQESLLQDLLLGIPT